MIPRMAGKLHEERLSLLGLFLLHPFLPLSRLPFLILPVHIYLHPFLWASHFTPLLSYLTAFCPLFTSGLCPLICRSNHASTFHLSGFVQTPTLFPISSPYHSQSSEGSQPETFPIHLFQRCCLTC